MKSTFERSSVLILTALLLLWVFTIVLSFQLDPFSDNLTGLGWVSGHRLWMILYAMYACLLNAYLSWKVFGKDGHSRNGWMAAACWVTGLIGCLIPYDPSGKQVLLSDFHLLFSVLGSAGYLLVMVYTVVTLDSSFAQRKSATAVMIALAPSLLFFALSQSISWLCEVSFICLNSSILVWNLMTAQKSK